MAIVNNQPNPINPDNYIGWSKAIEQPKADTSTGIALTGAGQALDEGVQVADNFVKGAIDTSLYRQVDEKRDALTADLKAYQAGQTAQPTPPSDPNAPPGIPNTMQWAANAYGHIPQSAGTPQSLLAPAQTDSIPPAIQNGLSRAGTLAQAAAGNPHLSQTLYDGQLDSIAKNMRAQFPGYRPYIDQQMSLITGKNPANAQINSLIEDINKGMANSKTEQEKPANLLREQDNIRLPGADQELARYLANPNAPGAANRVYAFVNKGQAYKYNFERQSQDHTIAQNSKADDLEAAKGQASDSATFHTNNQLDQLFADIGLDHPVKMTEALPMIQSRIVSLTAPQKVGIAQAIDAAHSRATTNLLADWDTVPRGGGPSLTTRLGPAERSTQLASLDKRFDDMKKSMTNAEFGSMAFQKQLNTAMEDQTTGNLYSNESYGNGLLVLNSIQKIDPKDADAIATSVMGSAVSPNYKPYVATNVMRIMGQPGTTDANGVYTITNALNDAKSKLPPAVAPAAYNEYLKTITKITDPNLKDDANGTIRSNAIQSFFLPANRNLLDKFDVDYTDANGNKVPGKFAVFTRNTSHDITNQVWDNGKLHPDNWEMYKSWGEDSFGRKLLPTIQDLGESSSGGKHYGASIDLKYDSDKHRIIGLIPGTNTETTGRYLYTFENKRLNDLNIGLNNLSHIYAKESKDGGEVDAKLLDMIGRLDPNMLKNVQGMPQKLARAIISSRGPERMDDTFSAFDKKTNEPVKYKDSRPPEVSPPISVPDTPNIDNFRDSFNSLPPTGKVVKGNLSDNPITGIQTQEIPEDSSLRQYYTHLVPKKKT